MARKPSIKKINAHTRKDNRYNRVLMTKCPICSYKSLSKFRENGYVWAECNNSDEN